MSDVSIPNTWASVLASNCSPNEGGICFIHTTESSENVTGILPTLRLSVISFAVVRPNLLRMICAVPSVGCPAKSISAFGREDADVKTAVSRLARSDECRFGKIDFPVRSFAYPESDRDSQSMKVAS